MFWGLGTPSEQFYPQHLENDNIQEFLLLTNRCHFQKRILKRFLLANHFMESKNKTKQKVCKVSQL